MRIKDLREDADLNQQVLAEYLNVGQSTYSQYENGKRQIPLEALVKLAQFYQVYTDYILGLTDKREPYGTK